MKYKDLDNNSRRILVDISQLYESLLEAQQEQSRFQGSMVWKRVNGKEYLYKLRNRKGHGSSLGPRSAKTESIYEDFIHNKEAVNERVNSLKEQVARQAKFCVAAGINRVPKVAADIWRVLMAEKEFRHKFIIVGTHALYAYENMAGVHFDSELLATNDIDVLWDSRKKINIAAEGQNFQSIMSILQKADKSFSRFDNKHYAAVNKKGFIVELIKPLPNPPMKVEPMNIGGIDDLQASEIEGLNWILSAPYNEVVCISEDGFPVSWVAPDPRIFAAHKLWLSKREDRNPIKKVRDYAQAKAVIHLILNYLDNYPFDKTFMKNLPDVLNDSLKCELDGIADKSDLDDVVPGF